MNLADHKSTKTERLSALNKLWHICGEVMRLLLKYCIYCASAPILHRESTDSLIIGSGHHLERIPFASQFKTLTSELRSMETEREGNLLSVPLLF